jgi:small-conductance mechanosensitive channel
MIARRVTLYTLLALVVLSVLRQLGLELGVLLGAAGVLTVALGFASQTSASNLISGLFLIGERPFIVGDVIQVGTTIGEVLSIDLMSVKLRTFDNLFVRMPNETLIKSEIVNITRFKIRRVDLPIGIAYKEDIGRVREVLLEVASANPLVLEEPAPLFIVLGYGSSSIDLQFSAFSLTSNYLAVKNELLEHIKRAFDRHGIEIPFPHVSVYAGAGTEPLPIALVRGEGSQPGSAHGRGDPRGDT